MGKIYVVHKCSECPSYGTVINGKRDSRVKGCTITGRIMVKANVIHKTCPLKDSEE